VLFHALLQTGRSGAALALLRDMLTVTRGVYSPAEEALAAFQSMAAEWVIASGFTDFNATAVDPQSPVRGGGQRRLDMRESLRSFAKLNPPPPTKKNKKKIHHQN
jgi:hypothetical protein